MKKIFILSLIFNFQIIYAQKTICGEIIYKKAIEFKVPKQKGSTYDKELQLIFSSLDKLNYILRFDKETAYFNLEKTMESDVKKLHRKAVSSGKGRSDFYTDLKNSNCIQVNKLGSETFLIKNTKPIYKLYNETKKINGYTCYKAIASETINFSKIKKGFEDQQNKVIIWYTNEIPVQFGPINFFGLPGLVLELQYANTIYTAVKINLTNTDIKITKPTKGKIISKEEYDNLIIKAFKEMDAN